MSWVELFVNNGEGHFVWLLPQIHSSAYYVSSSASLLHLCTEQQHQSWYEKNIVHSTSPKFPSTLPCNSCYNQHIGGGALFPLTHHWRTFVLPSSPSPDGLLRFRSHSYDEHSEYNNVACVLPTKHEFPSKWFCLETIFVRIRYFQGLIWFFDFFFPIYIFVPSLRNTEQSKSSHSPAYWNVCTKNDPWASRAWIQKGKYIQWRHALFERGWDKFSSEKNDRSSARRFSNLADTGFDEIFTCSFQLQLFPRLITLVPLFFSRWRERRSRGIVWICFWYIQTIVCQGCFYISSCDQQWT